LANAFPLQNDLKQGEAFIIAFNFFFRKESQRKSNGTGELNDLLGKNITP
jgi:hypothetical protein